MFRRPVGHKEDLCRQWGVQVTVLLLFFGITANRAIFSIFLLLRAHSHACAHSALLLFLGERPCATLTGGLVSVSLASCQKFAGKKKIKQNKKPAVASDGSLGGALSGADKSRFWTGNPDVFGMLWSWCYLLIISRFLQRPMGVSNRQQILCEAGLMTSTWRSFVY